MARQVEADPTISFEKKLGLGDVVAQSVAVMAPAMSGAFLTYQASTKAGGATPLAFLLGTLAMLCLGGVVALFSRTLASSGGLYTYVTHGLGKYGGYVAGWIYAVFFLTIGGAVMGGFGFFSSQALQSMLGTETPISWYWFFLGGLLVAALLTMFDISVSTRTQLVLAALTIGAMVLVSVVVISIGSPEVGVLDGETPIENAGASVDWSAFVPGAAGVSWIGVFFGMSFAMLSFTGSEASATLGEETRNPHKNVPLAVVSSILIVGLVYLVITYATSIGFGVEQATQDWPTSVAGLAAVAPGAAYETAVLAAAAISSFLCALGIHIAVSRILFTMGREKILPGWLGQLHPKYRVPWHAILFVLGTWLLVVIGSVVFSNVQTQVAVSETGSWDPTTGGIFAFSWLATISTPLVMFAYVLLGSAAIVFGIRNGKKGFVLLGLPAALAGAIAVFGGLYFSFADDPHPMIAFAPWYCLVVLAAGMFLGYWMRRSRPNAWSNLGRIFDE